jgi:hypothetical protein
MVRVPNRLKGGEGAAQAAPTAPADSFSEEPSPAPADAPTSTADDGARAADDAAGFSAGGSAGSDRPCFKIDLSGSGFGVCVCGQLKAAHVGEAMECPVVVSATSGGGDGGDEPGGEDGAAIVAEEAKKKATYRGSWMAENVGHGYVVQFSPPARVNMAFSSGQPV